MDNKNKLKLIVVNLLYNKIKMQIIKNKNSNNN